MDLSFNAEQRQLAGTARRLLAERATSAQLRERLAPDAGYDPSVFHLIASELGWTGILVPERHGGIGRGAVELVAVMEEMGRALLSSPFFATVALAEQLLLALPEDAQARYLPALASGECRAAVALVDAHPQEQAPQVTGADRDGEGFLVTADKTHVIDGDTADLLLIAVPLDGAPAIFAVPAPGPRLKRRRLRTLDPTRHQARVRLRDLRLPADALLAHGPAAAHAIEQCLRRAEISLAAEQVGGAERCLEMALEHARTRHQFGRPIGSFQAVKHMCADMFTQLETARSTCYYAAAVAALPDAESADNLGELTAIAKVACSEAYFFCASHCIQVHGGIGFTWEHDAHLHLKRARSGMALLGEPADHRELLAAALIDGEAGDG